MAMITLCHCFHPYCISIMSIVTPKLVSDAVANSQRANIYHLARRSRLQQLLEVEQRTLISAMANQSEPFGWSLTISLTQGLLANQKARCKLRTSVALLTPTRKTPAARSFPGKDRSSKILVTTTGPRKFLDPVVVTSTKDEHARSPRNAAIF
jgi:hypothetical protein